MFPTFTVVAIAVEPEKVPKLVVHVTPSRQTSSRGETTSTVSWEYEGSISTVMTAETPEAAVSTTGSGDTATEPPTPPVGWQAARVLFGWCLHHWGEPGGFFAETTPDRVSMEKLTMAMSATDLVVARTSATVGGWSGVCVVQIEEHSVPTLGYRLAEGVTQGPEGFLQLLEDDWSSGNLLP